MAAGDGDAASPPLGWGPATSCGDGGWRLGHVSSPRMGAGYAAQGSGHKMDSYNIKSDNVEDLNVQPLKKARISKSCEFESDKQMTECSLLSSPPSPIVSASSMKMDSHPIESSNVEDLEPTSLRESKCSASDYKTDIVLLDDGEKQPENIVLLDGGEKQPEQHEQLKVDQTYDYLPQDYTMTDHDLCAQIAIGTSLPTDVLVISAYISCMKDQLQPPSRNNFKVYFENPFISGLLKRDGKLGVDKSGKFMTEIVLIPINIKDSHWYLAVVNAQKCEIQVLDSVCWEFNRADLTSTQDFNTYNWKDLHVATWMIKEQLQKPIQKDGYKLAGILLCCKRNTTGEIPKFDPNSVTGERSNDVGDLKNLNDQKEFKALSEETKYRSLMSVLSKMSVQELVGGLCNYIKSINCAETLEKVWIGKSNPYSISLTEEIRKEDCPMDHDCFNLIFKSDYTQEMTRSKGTKSKHYLDLRFWILIPITQDQSGFVLVILNKDTRTVYILDRTPLDPIYKYNPMARYTKKFLWLAEYLPKVMAKACPGSRWNEDIFLWRQIILTDIPIYNRYFLKSRYTIKLSGYLISLFMCGWIDEHLRLPVLKDGYEIRKHILAHLLTYKENEYEDNLPAGVQDFIRLAHDILLLLKPVENERAAYWSDDGL
ncbi:LOW QUALITY PROTEIN: hypothetical protein U9M48_033342, partial [Paspalum notatum var. saurae]